MAWGFGCLKTKGSLGAKLGGNGSVLGKCGSKAALLEEKTMAFHVSKNQIRVLLFIGFLGWVGSTFADESGSGTLAAPQQRYYPPMTKEQLSRGIQKLQSDVKEMEREQAAKDAAFRKQKHCVGGYWNRVNNDDNFEEILDKSGNATPCETNADEQLRLGIYYFSGDFVEKYGYQSYVKNDDRAFYWFSESDKNGNALSALYLAFMYQHGIVVTQDYAKAVELYGVAANAGIFEPVQTQSIDDKEIAIANEVGVSLLDDREMVGYLRQKAKEDIISLALENAPIVVKSIDLETLCTELSDTGYGMATLKLAQMAENEQLSNIILSTPEKVIDLYKRAFNQGATGAAIDLGRIYETGKYFGVDYQSAQAWYKKGADAGNEEAKQKLDLLQEKTSGRMTGSSKNTSDTSDIDKTKESVKNLKNSLKGLFKK